MKKQTKNIENILYILAILIFVFLKSLSKAGLGAVAIFCAAFFLITALILPKWEENQYRFNTNSIPGGVKVFFAIVGIVGFLFLNMKICEYRLGGVQLIPNFFLALVLQSFTFLLGAGIYFVSYPNGHDQKINLRRLLVVLLACTVGFILLNFIFYSNIDDLKAEFKPTLRCYPGGSCYNAGDEQWGGVGAMVLLTVNLLQITLILNVLAGIFYFWKDHWRN